MVRRLPRLLVTNDRTAAILALRSRCPVKPSARQRPTGSQKAPRLAHQAAFAVAKLGTCTAPLDCLCLPFLDFRARFYRLARTEGLLFANNQSPGLILRW